MAEAIISASGTQYGLKINQDGSLNIRTPTDGYIQKIDYQDKMQPVYMGLALPGTSTGSPGWQIRKNTFSGTSPELIVSVLYGSGNTNFDKVWDNRSGTNEVYS